MEQTLTMQSDLFDHGVRLIFDGELNKQAEQQLRLYWEQGIGQDRMFMVLDLTKVSYINSGGIAILIRLARAGKKFGYRTFAFGVSPHYQKLFRMVGLTEYLMLYPDECATMERIAALEEEHP